MRFLVFVLALGITQIHENTRSTTLSTSGHFSITNKNCQMVGVVDWQDARTMTIDYTFSNQSHLTAFLFTGVFRDGHVNPDLVYVVPSRGHIDLAKKMLPVPAGMLVERPEIPLCVRVEPTQSISKTIKVPTPVQPWTPYLADQTDREALLEGLGDEVQAYFEVGFFLAPPQGAKLAQPAEIDGETFWRFDAFNPENQLIMRAGPISDLSVQVD